MGGCKRGINNGHERPQLASLGGFSRLSLIRGDAAALPLASDSFDLVALITVLEFLDTPAAAIQEAGRVVRHGLLLGVLNRLSPVAWWRRLRHAHTYQQARFFSPGELPAVVQSALAGRLYSLSWESGLYPLRFLDSLTWLPWGAFVGMSVRFS